jgi:septum formation protein
MGVPFEVRPVDVDETPPAELDGRGVAEALAERKAAAADETGAPILAADTVVVAADGELLGKPVDAADATRMLRKLAGTRHAVITGVCLRVGAARRTESAVTYITMRPVADDEIAAYVGSGECFGKAGAYAIQERGDRFVASVEGSWTNVVGLPVEVVQRLLDEAGLDVPGGGA